MKKRHLRDLYVRGTLHTIDDGTPGEEPVSVYLKKLNLNENEEAIRKANAARAVVIAAIEDPDSDLYKAALGDAAETDRANLIEYLISEPLSKARESAEAELGANPEWEDNDYLQGLNNAWMGGLNDKFHEDPEDEEAKKVFEALKRFADEVENVLEGEAKALRRDYEFVTEEELRGKAVKAFLKARSDLTWVDVYRKAELLLAVRNPEDPKERYFEELSEIDELETPVLLDLLRAYRDMTTDPQEGKDLPETPTS